MATPTTVLEFAQNARAADAATKAAAQAALQAAQTVLAAARAALATATTELTAKEKEIAAKRAEAAAADTPAEGVLVMGELSALLAELRGLQFALVQASGRVADAEGDAAVSTAELARASVQLTQAQRVLQEAVAANALRANWKAAATAPPLDALPADATAALGQDPYTAATDKVDDDIPAKLLEMARKGFEVETESARRLEESLDAAETLLMDELEENGGVAGLVVRRRMELDRAERALRDWTEQAKSRYDRALGLIRSVGGADALLSPSEHDGVEALDVAAGQDAADLRIALADAESAALDARLDLEEAINAARADDPTVDPATVQEVIDAQDALSDANAALTDARADFVASASDFLTWTGEMPDPAWRKLLAYLEGDAILQEMSGLAAADLTQLVDDVDTAEANLAEALDAATTHANSVAVFEAWVALRRERVTRTAATHPTRLLSAVRGDA